MRKIKGMLGFAKVKCPNCERVLEKSEVKAMKQYGFEECVGCRKFRLIRRKK